MELCRERDLRPGRRPLYRFADRGRGGRAAPTTPAYGLNASRLDPGRRAAAARVAARIKAGTVNINEGYAAAYGSYDAPMGGMKDSGLGRRHGAEGILKYTEAQTVASQRLLGFEPRSLGHVRRDVRAVHEPRPDGCMKRLRLCRR